MSWIDNQGYMHSGDAPHDFTYAPTFANGPTDIDQYGRKLGGNSGYGQDPGDLRPVPGQAPAVPAMGAVVPPPNALGAMGSIAPQGAPGLKTQSSDPNGPNYVPPGGNVDPQAAAAAAAQQALNNHFEYGGRPGGAADASRYFGGLAEGAQGRQGEQINYGRAQAYGEQAQGNAGAQGRVADLMWKRANGLVPSIAQMQGDRQMGQLTAAQTSAAASARGPAAMALAQQGAAANTAAGQSQISNQVQINAAQERQQAEQAAFGAYSGMRGQDFQGQGLEQDAAQKQAALNAAQRAANDQYSLGLYGNQTDINKAQLNAQGNQIGIMTGAQSSANALKQAGDQYNSSRLDKYIGYGMGAAGTGAAIAGMAIFGGTPNNNNGPVNGSGDPNGWNPGDVGYDANGAPVASNGGGFDPDHPNNSDISAKQNIRPLQAAAWDEGRRAALADMQRLSGKNAAELKGYGDDPRAGLVRDMRANAWDEGHAAPRGGDPVTAQFADGLAPSSYDYKPGLGSAGTKVGPMAQNMAANPTTGSAIRQNPRTGLLSIDNNDGIKVALGGVGHLAQRQQETDAKLRALAAQLQQGTQVQQEGLMAQGPAVRRISDGTKENGYNTQLTDGAEQAYQRYAQHQFPNGMNDDYDLRGAYASGTQRDESSMHYPDTYKKPNHETFSDESQYAADEPSLAGHWEGDRYRPKGPPAWLRQEQERPQVSVGDQYLRFVRGQ